MKERPISYTAEMMLARMADRKRNTRRMVNPQPDLHKRRHRWASVVDGGVLKYGRAPWRTTDPHNFIVESEIKCPYGHPGDRLWTRENYEVTWWDMEGRRVILRGYYLADDARFDLALTREESELFRQRQRKFGRMSGRFMYRSLSRGLDEILSVEVERVNDISEGDARAEGVRPALWFEPAGRPLHEHHNVDGVLATKKKTHRNAFATLWEKIHGPGAWKLNEWVWVIKFRRIK